MNQIMNVTCSEASERASLGALIVDVRDDDEFAELHVAGSFHVPLPDIEMRIAEIPKDRDVLLFCRSGRRSEKARELLEQSHSFSNVSNVDGGIIAWDEAGLPLNRNANHA